MRVLHVALAHNGLAEAILVDRRQELLVLDAPLGRAEGWGESGAGREWGGGG